MLLDLSCDLLFAAMVFLIYFFGVISGGIGLIVRPLLILLVGLPPPVAIGTARIASLGTGMVGFTQFYKYGKIDWKLAGILALPSAVGGIVGARIVTALDAEVLRRLIGAVILLLGALLVVREDIGTAAGVDDSRQGMKRAAGLVVFSISSLIASITGGGGILASATLIFLYGKTYITSAAIRRVASYGGACAAAAVFLSAGMVNWKYTIMLLLAGGLGSFFGVRFGIERGEHWGRLMVLVVVFVVGLRMLVF
jgi:uncharacterized membrane protein YfcA